MKVGSSRSKAKKYDNYKTKMPFIKYENNIEKYQSQWIRIFNRNYIHNNKEKGLREKSESMIL